MSDLDFELGESAARSCDCCGKISQTVWGYVYRNGMSIAVYYAGWSEGHPDNGVRFAIGFGRWGDGSSAQDRISVYLHCRVLDNVPSFMVVNHEDTAFAEADSVLGRSLRREEALSHSALQSVFEIADDILEKDPRVRDFLKTCGS